MLYRKTIELLVTGLVNMWVNIGRNQIHLPVKDAQVLRGHTGLVVPDLDQLVQRLGAVKDQLAQTKFAYAKRNDYVEVTCPSDATAKVNAITWFDLTTTLFPQFHEGLNIDKERTDKIEREGSRSSLETGFANERFDLWSNRSRRRCSRASRHSRPTPQTQR